VATGNRKIGGCIFAEEGEKGSSRKVIRGVLCGEVRKRRKVGKGEHLECWTEIKTGGFSLGGRRGASGRRGWRVLRESRHINWGKRWGFGGKDDLVSFGGEELIGKESGERGA